jgi:acyl-CoA thioesterase YciA
MDHKEELTIQVVAMPADANPDGDIFGGWLLSQMDLAAGVIAQKEARCRVVTIAIDSMVFKNPVRVGDRICCYAQLLKVGTTSMKIQVKVWVTDKMTSDRRQVTEGIFTFVAIDSSGNSQPVYRDKS